MLSITLAILAIYILNLSGMAIPPQENETIMGISIGLAILAVVFAVLREIFKKG